MYFKVLQARQVMMEIEIFSLICAENEFIEIIIISFEFF